VTQDPYPPGGQHVPYVDPPSGGGSAFDGFADNLPWYWDEAGPANPRDTLAYNTHPSSLDYADMPKEPRLVSGQSLQFTTSLAGIRPDGTFDVLYVFRWSSNYTGRTGGVSLRRGLGPFDPGFGGVFNVQLDLTDAELTPVEKAALARAGAANVTGADVTPPVITASADTAQLWPPNGKLVPVTIHGNISDVGVGVNPRSAAFAVTDEYGRVQPAGSIVIQPNGDYSFRVSLEASRAGEDADGRLYTVTIQAEDVVANIGSTAVHVTVPHDQR
jgi:hypothetical protein